MSQGMIDAAKARHTDPRAKFVHGVAAHEITDYTIVSGTYNMHINAKSEEWVEYVQASLKQLWQHTRFGLSFKMLSDDNDERYDGLYYADPIQFLTFARENLSPEAEVVIDPPLPDFTVLVRRPSA